MPATEFILAAAIAWKGRVYSMPRPGRHGDVIAAMWAHGVREVTPPDAQGFVTDRGRFVGREDAMQIAIAAGQPLLPELTSLPELYSETLW